MPLHLTIENETSLPDGGPLSYTITGKRGIDIGRDAYLDWALPDPTKTVSGKHCEIRYRDGGYWLHDVSRNGTFLNRSASRMQEAHRLRDGDRIEIGRYIIAVRLDGQEAQPEPSAGFAPAGPAEFWAPAGDAAPPISPRELRPARELRPVQADFREWAIDVPAPGAAPSGYGQPHVPAPPVGRANQPFEDMGWAQGPAPTAPPPEPYLPVPTPRRPGVPPGGGTPWDAPADTGAAGFGWGERPPAAAPVPQAPDWGASPPLASPPAEVGWAAGPSPPASAGWAAAPAAPAGWASPQPVSPASPPTPENPWGKASLAGPERARVPPEPVVPPAPATAPTRVGDFAAAPAPSAPPALGPAGAPSDFVTRFAKGAGVAPEVFGWRDPGDLAEELGSLMRLAAENVKQLLNARAESKRVARTGSQTMIQALDNNPLKFSPTPDDALRIMFGRPSSGYLDARRAFEQSFKDLKTHQVKTYSAMQHALRLLMEDLDPAAIEESAEGGGGLGALLGSKKAKLWDLYCTRWDTLTSPHEDGMVDAFMMFFAECYDRGGGKT